MGETAAQLPPARSYPEDRRAWIRLAAGVVALLALLRFIGCLHKPWQQPPRERTPAPFRLAVLAYGDVGTESTSDVIDCDKVARQLLVLREAGFHFVTLRDVEAAYYAGGQMPERAVLLTFDLGLRMTAELVHPILEDLAIPAVLFVDTGKIEVADRRTVYWDRLKEMTSSGYWEIGSHGHTPYKRPPANFFELLTLRRHSAPANDPFLRSKHFLESNVHGSRVTAFAPQTGRHFAFARKESARGEFSYELGFWDDLFGVNDDLTDPHWLLRLRITPEWSDEEFLRRVDWATSSPTQNGTSDEAIAHWRGRTGSVQFTGDGFVLSGGARNDVWFLGSQWLTEWELRTEIRADADEFWIVQESRLDPGHSWRFGGTREMLYVQTRDRDHPPRILASAPHTMAPDEWHRIRLVKRGAGVWIDVDGKPIFTGAVALPGRQLGKIGLVCAQADGLGSIALRSPRIRAVPYQVSPISGNPDAGEITALLTSAPTLAAVSPPLFKQNGASLAESPVNMRRIRMLCAKHGLNILPAVSPTDSQLLDDSAFLQNLLTRGMASAWDGYRIELGNLTVESRARWLEAMQASQRPYYRAGLRLMTDTDVADGGATP